MAFKYANNKPGETGDWEGDEARERAMLKALRENITEEGLEYELYRLAKLHMSKERIFSAICHNFGYVESKMYDRAGFSKSDWGK